MLVGPNSEGSSGLGPKTKAAWWISEARVRVLVMFGSQVGSPSERFYSVDSIGRAKVLRSSFESIASNDTRSNPKKPGDKSDSIYFRKFSFSMTDL